MDGLKSHSPTLRSPSSIPKRFRSSMLRQFVMSIFGHEVVVSFLSMSMHDWPLEASCRAAIRPAGPAPTTRTGVVCSTLEAIVEAI